MVRIADECQMLRPPGPLAPLVDAHDLRGDPGAAPKCAASAAGACAAQNSFSCAVPAEREAQLEDRVGRPHQHLGLGHGSRPSFRGR